MRVCLAILLVYVGKLKSQFVEEKFGFEGKQGINVVVGLCVLAPGAPAWVLIQRVILVAGSFKPAAFRWVEYTNEIMRMRASAGWEA